MKSSKFDKVIAYVKEKRAFTFKDFEKKFGSYSSTEFNYLRQLVEAKIVVKPRAGIYYLNDKIPKNLNTAELLRRSKIPTMRHSAYNWR